MFHQYIATILGISTLANAKHAVVGMSGSCSSNFKICAPEGVKTNSLGPIGPAWGDLFNNIVATVSDYGISRPAVAGEIVDPTGVVRREQALCCKYNGASLDHSNNRVGSNVADCLLVAEFDIAMCWVSIQMILL